MKTKLLILLLFTSSIAFGQFDLTVSVANGISKLSKNDSHSRMFGEKIDFAYSGGIEAFVEYKPDFFIHPKAGIAFYSLGNELTYGPSYMFPNLKESFRFNYLQLNVGISTVLVQKIEIDLSAINGIMLSEQLPFISNGNYDFALSPTISYRYNKLKVGVSYYHGFISVWDYTADKNSSESWDQNRAFYLKIGYSLLSF